MRKVEDICEEFSFEFQNASSLDERLTRSISHRISCPYCKDSAAAEEVISELRLKLNALKVGSRTSSQYAGKSQTGIQI